MPAIKPLEIGDYIVRFELPASDGQTISPDLLVGKSLVLHFYGKADDPQTVARLCEFRDRHAKFAERGIVVLGLGLEPIEAHSRCAKEHSLPFQLLSDSTARTFLEYGALKEIKVDGEPAHMPVPTTYLIGPNFRVEHMWQELPASGHAADVLEGAMKLLEPEPARQILQLAPVLLLPNVLPPHMCKRLMDLWETDNGDSGFMRQVDGKTVGIYDYSHKIRRDHFIQPSPLMTELQEYIKHRVIVPISQAFNYAATRREDYRVACYDSAKGGYFRPHRDNTTAGTAHRRFAMSLLLNDDYEGGSLRFPEFGQHKYRPAAGGAVIFSSSLLHEATDVTAGRRFVLLSFFYGEAEAKQREEYNRQVGGEYRARTPGSGT